MKKYGLGFDNESIKESIIENYTGRNHNLRKFIEFLNSQENYSKIALDGEWGSGKTYFIKQLQYVLNYDNSQNFKSVADLSSINNLKINYEVVYFDSWKYESENIDPIILLFNLIQKELPEATDLKFKESVIKAMELIIQFSTKGRIKIQDFYDILQKEKEKDPIDEFKDALNNYLNNIPDIERLVIIIDELDRCKPTYAINLLERVQHCLDNKKLTFVFSTNLSELSNTVKQIYGANFNGDSYLDRFFDYTLVLPEPNLKNYYSKIIPSESRDLFDIANEVAKYFNFTLRQLNHYFSRISLLKRKMNQLINIDVCVDDNLRHYYLIKYFAPFMIALKMSNNKDYNEFLNGNKGNIIINFLKKNYSFKSEFDSIISNTKIDEKSLKEGVDKSLLQCEKIIGTIYTGLFSNNENYYNFCYPPRSDVPSTSSNGNTEEDKKYLLDIVSLIGEDIEY